MADTKITNLTAETAAGVNDVLPVVDLTGPTTKKIKVSDLVKMLITSPYTWGNVSPAQTQYLDSGGSEGTNETDAGNIMAYAGTIKNLYVAFSANTIDTGTLVFTMMKNGSAQSVTCTANAGDATTVNDTTHSFTVAAGDRITIRVVVGGSTGGANPAIAYEIVPAT